MSDIADDADEQIQANLDLALQQARSQRRRYQPCGACHFCGEEVTGQKIFCDSDCEQLQAREVAARIRRTGG